MYTRSKVIAEKRCGIKYFDKAVAVVGREALIENALKLNRDNPKVWNPGWSNFDWALGNAVSDVIKPKNDIMQSYNPDEVFTAKELVYIQDQLGDDAMVYRTSSERKKEKVVKRTNHLISFGDHVKMSEELKQGLMANGSFGHLDEFGDCIGTVIDLVDYNNCKPDQPEYDPNKIGPELNVRWQPSNLRYCYNPNDLIKI